MLALQVPAGCASCSVLDAPEEYVGRRVKLAKGYRKFNLGYVAEYRPMEERYLVKYGTEDNGYEEVLQRACLDVILVNLKGASYEEKRKSDKDLKWKAQSTIGGKYKNLGYFKTEYEAAKMYDANADEARQNFRSTKL